MVILVDMVSGCITFSEAPRLAQKCGPVGVTILFGFCNPPRRGCGKPGKTWVSIPPCVYSLLWYSIC
jgi:hypothetical protein